jgi:phospholipase D1/2
MDQLAWLRVAVVLIICGLLVVAWRWIPVTGNVTAGEKVEIRATGSVGRWLGPDRVARLGGERVTTVTRALRRNGTLAVFFVRKVPAPFILANIVIGASTVRYRDFLVGTVLGMGAIVIALAGFGYQLTQALRNPSPGTALTAAVFVGVPLTLAWFVNRGLRRARPSE